MDPKLKIWLEFVQSSGVPLRELDENGNPCSIGAGCLIDIKGRRFLLTVFHVTKRSSKWVVQIKYDDKVDKVEVCLPGLFNYLGDFDQNKKAIREVEFAFVEVPSDLECVFQHINDLGQCFVERPRAIFVENDVVDPNPLEIYGFAGDVKPYLLDSGKSLVTEHQTYPGLKYDRIEGDFHCFKLPVSHPGHESFKGCSGSPILDKNRKLVGLVNHGCIEKNEIYGVNLAKCIRTISQAMEMGS
jgi:hypothetical protein